MQVRSSLYKKSFFCDHELNYHDNKINNQDGDCLLWQDVVEKRPPTSPGLEEVESEEVMVRLAIMLTANVNADAAK